VAAASKLDETWFRLRLDSDFTISPKQPGRILESSPIEKILTITAALKLYLEQKSSTRAVSFVTNTTRSIDYLVAAFSNHFLKISIG